MAKTTKNNFQPNKRNNYKTVVRMAEGGNVSELNYSERKEYIEQNYSPFITEAQMIFSIWDSGIEYDLKGDRKEVADSIIESYKSLGDYTEESLPKETVYEIQDWDLVRKDIDPETDEVIGETSLTEVTADNTYNFSYLGLVDLNWRVYYDEEYEKYFYVIMPHLGGDIRGNYGDAIILEGSDKEELFYRYYEGFISGGASVYLKFKDGSEISFDSEQDSDVFYFRVSESFEPTGMAQKYLEDFEKFDSWQGDEFLEETIDIFLMRKGIAPKMMAGGRLDDETPSAYIQLLGYNEGKWIDLTDFSDGDDVIAHISDFMSELNAEFGGNREEYIFTDYEGFGRDMYDENMGSNEFDEILEGYEKYKDSDFPKEVITEYINDSGNSSMSLADVIDQMENNNLGKYDNYSDFGYNQVNQGYYSPTDNDVYVTDTDKRIMAGEESDNEASNMDFDALIERADNTRSEYEREKNSLEEEIAQVQDDIDSLNELKNSSDDGDDFDNISEQIEEKELELSDLEERLEDIDSRYEDDARNEVQEILYDEIYDRLENDLGSWLEDYGMTSELENISFLSVDYEKIGEELASDYLVVEYEGSIYIFSNFSKGGRIKASKTKTKYDFYIVENSTKKLVSGYSTKAEAVEQRKLLVEQYPAMRFEIYPLAKLETKTQLDVNAKKDYVELSTLDKIKKVSVDTLRYGQEKVGQAQMFLEKNDVKGKIKRGARKVADKTKQGANWLRGKWLEADFGDGTGRAKFFADGGGVEIGSTFESENDSLNTFKGYNNYFCIEFNGKVLHSVKTKSQHLKKLNELVDKYNLTEIKQKNSEFDDGGAVSDEIIIKSGNNGNLKVIYHAIKNQRTELNANEVFEQEKIKGKSVFLFVNDELYDEFIADGDENKFADGGVVGSVKWVKTFEEDDMDKEYPFYVAQYKGFEITLQENYNSSWGIIIEKDGKVVKRIGEWTFFLKGAKDSAIDFVDEMKNKFDNGGGVGGERFNLSFNYNPSNISNEDAEKIVKQYTNDWKHNNDFDNVSFYVFNLTKEKADELKALLKMEDVFNIEIEKSSFADGGRVRISVLNELYNLKDKGVTQVQLNGFTENIGYVIGLRLDDTEIEKVGNNAYITLYKNGGGVDSKAEKLANTIRKDYQNGVVVKVNNDYGDSAYFSISAPFEYSLSKETAKEINKKYFNGKGEISGSGNEHYLNVNFDLDNFADGGEVGNYELLKKIKKEFGNPPKGSDIRALKEGLVEVFYCSPNEDAKNWAMKVKNKFGFGRLPSSIQYNSAIIYVDTFKMADGGVSYEPITKPVPTTKPKERTKPDKDNPYKPKGIPKPKATKM